MGIQAVLVAGDRGYSRSVRGRSKAFVEIGGKPMIVHVLEALIHTPEVDEVYVVGNDRRIESALRENGVLPLATARGCPIHVVPQRRSLYENVWHTFQRTQSATNPDPEHAILVVPVDIPLVMPEEISQFIDEALRSKADYAIGLTPEVALAPFRPTADRPGIDMACFHLSEGRFRQNNLHFVRPLKMGNRTYIQDVYENRYQKEWGSMIRLGARILRAEWRNLWVLFFYALMHLGSVLDRHGHRRAADRVRAWVSLRNVERGIGAMLRTEVRTVNTGLGGAALDIDNDADLEVAEKMLGHWKAYQARLLREHSS